MTGPWLDAGLLVALAASALAWWRLSAHGATAFGPAGGAASSGFDTPAGSTSRVVRLIHAWRGYFPRLSRQAGFDPASLRWVYWAAKFSLAILGPLLVLELTHGAIPLPVLLVLAIVGLALPDLVLWLIRRRRQQRIRGSLSYFLDLLVALVLAGASVEGAFARAGTSLRQGRSHPLADEVNLIAQELRVGKDRAAAFNALAERTGVREIKALASALRVGLELGTPVQTVLTHQADILRARRRANALKQINRAAIQAVVPTLLCGFPILLLLVLFPAVLEVFEAFTLLKTVLH